MNTQRLWSERLVRSAQEAPRMRGTLPNKLAVLAPVYVPRVQRRQVETVRHPQHPALHPSVLCHSEAEKLEVYGATTWIEAERC